MEIDISYEDLEGVFNIEQYCKAHDIDVEEVKELWCSDNNLTELKGLDKLVNLKVLYCDDNELTELKGLDKLVNLKVLYCFDNKLIELNGLDKLVNLKVLYCDDNELTELKGLDKLVNLKVLYCFDNKLTELDLSKLVNLEVLNGERYTQPDRIAKIIYKIDSLFERIENIEQNIAEIKSNCK